MAKGTVNKVIVLGRLGQKPEIRYTSDGSAVANISVATNEVYKGETKTEWHRIVAFGKTAENINQYLDKGSQVYIEGRLQTSMWEKDAVKHYKTEIVAHQVQFLDSRGSGGGSTPSDHGSGPPYSKADNSKAQGGDDDDSLPF